MKTKKIYAKRIFDSIIAFLLIIITSPIMLLLALLILGKLGSPIFFVQRRTGLEGREFSLYKFRTMLDSRDEEGRLLPKELRVSKFGNVLRRTSLDELPSLFNVIKGDMSLVGPRPLLPDYLPYYSKKQNRRHEVKPGITGWAQVNGRNVLDWEKRFELDVWYVDNWSLWLDLKILFMTLIKTIKKEDISPKDKVSMERFDEVVRRQREE